MRRKILPLIVLLLSSTAFGNDALRTFDAEVRVKGVAADGDVVTGVIENHSDLLVRNPKILVRHSWLWADEFAPGQNSPGRSEIFTVSADVPPGGSFVFTRELPRGPSPTDHGRFMTTAEIVGFEQIGRRPMTRSMR
jgi:hypothetical protein